VALVRSDVLEDRIASIIRIKRTSKPVTALAVTINTLIILILMIEAMRSSETSILIGNNTASHPSRRHSSQSPPRKLQILLNLKGLAGLYVWVL
jgi:hypothetical protein